MGLNLRCHIYWLSIFHVDCLILRLLRLKCVCPVCQYGAPIGLEGGAGWVGGVGLVVRNQSVLSCWWHLVCAEEIITVCVCACVCVRVCRVSDWG